MGNRPFGLLGRKLSHSFSPAMHKSFGEITGKPYEYIIFEKEPEQLAEFLKGQQWEGLNVTIPYKEEVMKYCDYISDAAREIGAVNTLVRRGDKIHGYNTDYIGLKASLESYGVDVKNEKAMILGTGGASKAAYKVLEDMGAAKIYWVSRSGEINYENLEQYNDVVLIINATPIGMYPNMGKSLVKPENFPGLKWVMDMIYNPLRSKLLCDTKLCQKTYISGLGMLVGQGASASKLFTGTEVPLEGTMAIEKQISLDTMNIVLIGMPGSGKSTVGRLISERLNWPLIDTDQEIIEKAGKEIPKIFEEEGEAGFRKIEKEVILQLQEKKCCVISCGGGVIKNDENFAPLGQNGRIFFLNRPIKDLPIDGRPLSMKNSLDEMFKERLPLYRKWCDVEIEVGDKSPKDVAEEIISLL